jgi:hypothetical protein
MQSNIRPVAPLLALLLAAALILLGAVGSLAASPRGCGSFTSQAEAQGYFVEAGGSIEHAVGSLDPDRDGVACEGLNGPYIGYATLGFNKKHDFLYGTASMPPRPDSGEYPCLVGNLHFIDAARRVRIFKVTVDGDKLIADPRGAGVEAKPVTGRLVWRMDRKVLAPGRYFAEFEERQATSPSGGSECPAFRSPVVSLP